MSAVPAAAAASAGEDVVRASLGRLRAMNGLISACLVEPGSGQVLETVMGEPPGDAARERAAALVAAAGSDILHVIRLLSASLGDSDDVADVIITVGDRHHLLRPLPAAGVDGLFVVVTLDRDQTNLALARRQLQTIGSAFDPTPGRASQGVPGGSPHGRS